MLLDSSSWFLIAVIEIVTCETRSKSSAALAGNSIKWPWGDLVLTMFLSVSTFLLASGRSSVQQVPQAVAEIYRLCVPSDLIPST